MGTRCRCAQPTKPPKTASKDDRQGLKAASPRQPTLSQWMPRRSRTVEGPAGTAVAAQVAEAGSLMRAALAQYLARRAPL